uniref:Uncharacterized protein n=1 Tax=Clavulina sp. TaxID=1745192 RepID=A0A890JE76_9AGAM|nr:hypothetical protein [Clavulina sp.]
MSKLNNFIYYIQLSNKIPNSYLLKNNYLKGLIILRVVSSIIVRIINIDVSKIVSPFLTFILYNIIIFSVIFIIYLQSSLIFKIGYMIKNIPLFIIKIKENNALDIKIYSSYFLINFISIGITIWVINRMIVISNFKDLYMFALTIGLFISLFYFLKKNKSFNQFNYNIQKYPLWMVFLFMTILLSLWILLPYSFIKLIETYKEVLGRYNTFLNSTIILNMSDSSTINGNNNIQENQNNFSTISERETSVSTSESHSNNSNQDTSAITSTNTWGNGTANSFATSRTHERIVRNINQEISEIASESIDNSTSDNSNQNETPSSKTNKNIDDYVNIRYNKNYYVLKNTHLLTKYNGYKIITSFLDTNGRPYPNTTIVRFRNYYSSFDVDSKYQNLFWVNTNFDISKYRSLIRNLYAKDNSDILLSILYSLTGEYFSSMKTLVQVNEKYLNPLRKDLYILDKFMSSEEGLIDKHPHILLGTNSPEEKVYFNLKYLVGNHSETFPILSIKYSNWELRYLYDLGELITRLNLCNFPLSPNDIIIQNLVRDRNLGLHFINYQACTKDGAIIFAQILNMMGLNCQVIENLDSIKICIFDLQLHNNINPNIIDSSLVFNNEQNLTKSKSLINLKNYGIKEQTQIEFNHNKKTPKFNTIKKVLSVLNIKNK